ncbi:methionine-tRNA ligase [Emergomyces pasteurianus Ep9510]|uniref:Probable methionine--tRNA ligase, mitochondrial n=1 Tax=Emergomyces pasteurianus Ep9510 TaxID=1447872 RepID=A0A1J9PAS6_9EURO|nr:methionine-tRNA ligase [Emergomyces pasteurianus Ep9510]
MLDFELRAVYRAVRFTRPTSRRTWICSPCMNALLRRPQWRALNTAPSQVEDKPFYVTTPIFYVNAAPHVGHLYTMILADVLKRWQILLGNTDAKLLTGTDEHGLKIQQAAAALGMTPQELCDQNCQTFKNIARKGNVDYDHFIRTTDVEHKEAVRYFWDMLNHRGYIYTSKHEGWYSVSDEAFYPPSAVQPTLDPSTGRKLITSIETGKEVQWTSEENYHFRLSAFKEPLLEHFRKNPNFIMPSNYMDGIVAAVSSGLQDLSISRPASRLKWGIPVPYDESQVIYVWLDALVNYITYAGYPFPPGSKSIWPADVQVVGKDILRFHCIYWPAFLMALDIPLPRQILAHAHWTINHEKMSKSTGNVVNPNFAIERFNTDTMRFYLTIDGAQSSDSDYENSYIVERYKKGLQWGIGNLTSRLLRGKKWSVRDSIVMATEGQLKRDKHQDLLESIPERVEAEMEQLDPRKALNSIMEIIYQTNKYFHEMEPWALVKAPSAETHTKLNGVLYTTAESLRIAGILLQPFMPQKSSELLDMLGVAREVEKRNFNAAKLGADHSYGVPLVDLKEGTAGTLFPPLISEA